ncbi:MAG: RidA family protein [Fimbriimonadaceae bacterium]|nr:RidA family protein [Alphaproteobacteria bacterium]
MIKNLNPISIAAPASAYSHGVFVPAGSDVIVTSGTLGLEPDGKLAGDFEAQCHLVWANTNRILNEGGMDLSHIVKITTYLPRRGDAVAYRTIRDQYLSHQPASTVIIADLISPDWLIETEVIAARESAGRIIEA